VVVKFDSYCGPVWDENNPQSVPISTVTVSCCSHDCERTYLPLQLAFAKTIDTFQGLNAGPVDAGRPPNAVQRIICDPGNRTFECRKPGLFFTILSRGTTIGHLENSKRLDSAVYFYDFGYNSPMTVKRITNLRCCENGRVCKPIIKREKWVEKLLLKASQHKEMTDDEINNIFEWSETTRVSTVKLESIIESDIWRSPSNDVP
jgi:hypothetical protein